MAAAPYLLRLADFSSTYSADLPTGASDPTAWAAVIRRQAVTLRPKAKDVVLFGSPGGYGPRNWLDSSQEKLLHLWGVPGSGRLIHPREAVSAEVLNSSRRFRRS
jgi:hypothetical protein